MAKCIIYGARGGSESPITITIGFSKSVASGTVVTCASELLAQPIISRAVMSQAVFEVYKKGSYTFTSDKFDDLTVNVRTCEPVTATMQETLVRVTVYGAVNETITINGKQTVTSNAGTATMDLAPGTYVPSCSVSGWNKPVTVSKGITKVYCRPTNDKCVYWYGWKGDGVHTGKYELGQYSSRYSNDESYSISGKPVIQVKTNYIFMGCVGSFYPIVWDGNKTEGDLNILRANGKNLHIVGYAKVTPGDASYQISSNSMIGDALSTKKNDELLSNSYQYGTNAKLWGDIRGTNIPTVKTDVAIPPRTDAYTSVSNGVFSVGAYYLDGFYLYAIYFD